MKLASLKCISLCVFAVVEKNLLALFLKIEKKRCAFHTQMTGSLSKGYIC